jgi:hypothetical protein
MDSPLVSPQHCALSAKTPLSGAAQKPQRGQEFRDLRNIARTDALPKPSPERPVKKHQDMACDQQIGDSMRNDRIANLVPMQGNQTIA